MADTRVNNDSTEAHSPGANDNGSQPNSVSNRDTERGRTPGPSSSPLNFFRVFCLVFGWTVLLLSGGIPYWYYYWLRPGPALGTDDGDTRNTQRTSEGQATAPEHSKTKVRPLVRVWEIHQVMVGIILAPMFPLISISPLPKCSWAYIFAIFCLLYGLMTFAVCVLYKEYFEAPETGPGMYRAWKRSTRASPVHEDSLRLWVFLSLPTVWFAGFLASFGMAVLMIVVEAQAQFHNGSESAPSIGSGVCNGDQLRFLRATVPLIIVFIGVTLAYMKSVARDLSVAGENA